MRSTFSKTKRRTMCVSDGQIFPNHFFTSLPAPVDRATITESPCISEKSASEKRMLTKQNILDQKINPFGQSEFWFDMQFTDSFAIPFGTWNCQTTPCQALVTLEILDAPLTYFLCEKCVELCSWDYVLKILRDSAALTPPKAAYITTDINCSVKIIAKRTWLLGWTNWSELRKIDEANRAYLVPAELSRATGHCDWPIFPLVHWTKSRISIPSLSFSLTRELKSNK